MEVVLQKHHHEGNGAQAIERREKCAVLWFRMLGIPCNSRACRQVSAPVRRTEFVQVTNFTIAKFAGRERTPMRFEELPGGLSLFLRFLSQAQCKVPHPSRILRRMGKNVPSCSAVSRPFRIKRRKKRGAERLWVRRLKKGSAADWFSLSTAVSAPAPAWRFASRPRPPSSGAGRAADRPDGR